MFKHIHKKYHKSLILLYESYLIIPIILFDMDDHKQNPFLKIKANLQPTQMDSQCPRCLLSGVTTILMAQIPLFRQILICSFYCENCGERNNQVQFAGKLPDFGVGILFKCLSPEDLNRQIIKSQNCIIKFNELDLELPPKRAEITTIQSLLRRTYDQLIFNQSQRKQQNLEEYNKIAIFLEKVNNFADGKSFPLTLKIRDPSGNSTIKNPHAPKVDKNMQVDYFRRTKEELKQMGYSIENAEEELRMEKQKEVQLCGSKLNFVKPFQQDDVLKHEPVTFDVPCQVCLLPGKMTTCSISVPYFSDLVIMSFTCDFCGYHNTETKTSGQIGAQALVITLNVQSDEDLKRDLLKSQTCFVSIPQIELQLDYGTLGGVFTTVEGLLQKIHDHLCQYNPFADSDKQFGTRMDNFLQILQEMQSGKRKFTLQLVDPLGRSFIQNRFHPSEDKNCKRQLRERTYEQNQMLGLNDMKVENYAQ